ncbi:hypothetical protein [Candidatus Endomicrobiellum agilis]|uniref:hypothetical protein n=1 Tax=Candidatus Endomicrobiellum agilis TaxID=3238957 RepID=UPI0035775BF2|nr:hypothetical protein [Endomicrobium sp.]
MSVCEVASEETMAKLERLNDEIISYVLNIFYVLNKYEGGLSVMTFEEQSNWLEVARKASEIYSNMNAAWKR